MVTVTLDEITLNAIKAALDERISRLEITIGYWEASQKVVSPEWDESAERALVWNVAALHETKLAREIVGDAEVVPEQADDVTAAKAYADLGYHAAQAAYRR